MNIGETLGVTFLSNEAGTSVMGNVAAAVRSGSAALTGESPFQKLITLAMANNITNVTGSENGSVLASESTQGTNSISDMLAGLLSSNANQVKMKMQTVGMSSTSSEEVEELLQDDTDATEFDVVDSVASILAMFEGSYSAYMVTNSGNVNSEPSKIELGTDTVAALLESVQTNSLSSINQPNNQNITGSAELLSYTVDGNGYMTVQTNINGQKIEFSGYANEAMMSDLYGEKSEITGTNPATNVEEIATLLKSNGQSEDLSKMARLKSIDSDQTELKTGRQETAIQSEMKISEEGSRVPLKVDETEQSLQPGLVASNEKLETELDSIETSVKTVEFQGQLQSAGTTGATTVNQISQPVDETEAYSQISGEILAKLEKKGPTEFKMQLEPESLGQIDISLKLNEGKLIIDISAESSKTQSLLISQVDKLISSMGLQNVQVESVQVNQQMNSGGQNSQNLGYQMSSGMDFSQRRQHSQETGGNFRQSSFGIFGTQSDAAENISGILQTKNFNKLDYVI